MGKAETYTMLVLSIDFSSSYPSEFYIFASRLLASYLDEKYRFMAINRVKSLLAEKQLTSKWLAKELGRAEISF